MTAAPTMKTVASDVRPADTPSIGTGNASAITADPRSARAPSAVDPSGGPVASDHTAATTRKAAATETTAMSGSARRISGEAGGMSVLPIQTGRCGGYLRAVCVIVSSVTPQNRRLGDVSLPTESAPKGRLSSARVGGLVGEGLRLDAEGAADCTRTVAHPELVVHVVEVFADRSRRDVENGGDLTVRLPLRNPEKDLALAGSHGFEQPRLPSTSSRVAPELNKVRLQGVENEL